MIHQICIPIAPCGGKFKNFTELRYALRSIEKHFTDPYQITLIGPQKPQWFQNGKWIQQTTGRLKTAVKLAAQEYPEGFFWWYDDSVLIQDQTAEEIKQTPARPGWGRILTSWGRKLEEIRSRLTKEGHTPWDYSKPHGPYWFDASMIDESFHDWPGMLGKFPFETWILSKRDWPRRFGIEAQYYSAFKNPPAQNKIFVNWCDRGFTPELIQWLDQHLPRHSRFEAESGITLPKIAVHTLRYGTAWWIDACASTLDSWAKKHGHTLRIWTDTEAPPEYPCPKYLEIDMLREFLASDADWIFYVDADVWVDPSAPAHPELLPGFHIMTDPPSKFSRGWSKWAQRHFGKQNLRGWHYKNAGVWMCDRASAEAMLAVIRPPYVECMMDQNQWNLWACQAHKNGMPVHELPMDWNSFSGRMTKAHFQHIAGQKKAQKWHRLKAAGIIYDIPTTKPMPTFDLQQFPLVESEWMQMDDRHIYALHAAACSDWEGTRIAVEIGPWKGRTTAALIAALNAGKLDHLHIIEVKPTRELRAVIACATDPAKVTLHTIPSWDTTIPAADFVFIDGDHRWPAIADTLRALTWGAKVICMHDSQSYPRIKDCWGSWNAAKMLKQTPGREWEEDAIDRPGEKTFRGFLISRKTP
jgi:hypothetical protein